MQCRDNKRFKKEYRDRDDSDDEEMRCQKEKNKAGLRDIVEECVREFRKTVNEMIKNGDFEFHGQDQVGGDERGDEASKDPDAHKSGVTRFLRVMRGK